MKKMSALLLVMPLPVPSVAQVKQTMSEHKERTRSEELEAKIDSLFAPVSNTASPGCAVAVIQNGRVIAKKAYGSASGLGFTTLHTTPDSAARLITPRSASGS